MSKPLLLLYDFDYVQASTVSEHIESFTTCSSFSIQAVNVHSAWKFSEQNHLPSALEAEQIHNQLNRVKYQGVILHYTLFGMDIYYLGTPILEWLHTFKGLKIAFFQDEYYKCPKRFNFINEFNIDVVYTLLEPQYFRQTYIEKTKVCSIHSTIPGFVSERLLTTAKITLKKNIERDIDVGYRGRRIDFALGSTGREKHVIGEQFKSYLQQTNFVFDIETDEKKRIYGEAWPQFLARCRTVLGVEAGVSIFDLEDEVRLGVAGMRAENPNVTEKELFQYVMTPWENKINYRTISPRHFEAAVLLCCQVLFEGRYSGIMESGYHYIELKKDFSNIDDVLLQIKDINHCKRIAQNAKNELIDSGWFTYKTFFKKFDAELRMLGLTSVKQ